MKIIWQYSICTILLSLTFFIKAEDKPNIVFIFSDDHACAAVSAYGSRINKTPNIDRIAKEGMIFNHSFVTNSICAPSRAVILTGKHSHLNGQLMNGQKFNTQQQTFPKILQKNGYQTALIGKWHLRAEPTGFDYFDVLPGQGHYYNPTFISAQGSRIEKGYISDVVTNLGIEWMEKNKDKSKPFMLMLQHKAPHRHWKPGPKHLNTYDDVSIPEPETLFDDYKNRASAASKQAMTIDKHMRLGSDLKVWDKSKPLHGHQRMLSRLSESEKKAWDQAYDKKNQAFLKQNLKGKELVSWKYQRYIKDYLRTIASIDDNIGRVLDYLDKSGLAKNTVIIYASDNGFYLGEHGWYDKRFMYEPSLRTPFVVRWPGVIKAGSQSDKLIQNLDYAQTFLDIAGIKAPKDMQGQSLKPLMQGKEDSSWRESIYYHYYEGEHRYHNVYKHYGVRTDRYKLIYYYTLKEWECFDLEKDPHELKNVYNDPQYKEIVNQLNTELIRLRKQYKVPEDRERVRPRKRPLF